MGRQLGVYVVGKLLQRHIMPMVGNMALTTERIHQAADELDAEGIRPTLAAVRKKLGSTGSFTTISEAMASWRTARAGQQPPSEPLPDAVAERLASFSAEVWSAAVAAAAARIAGEREALATQRAELEATRDEAVALADSLANELDEARTAARKESDQLQQALGRAERTAEAARSEASSARTNAEDARVQLASLTGRLGAVEAERDRLAAELAAAQQEIGRLSAPEA